ncbi:hypothetical protein ACFU6I_14285 [Streptomyces sp. NPDC057486]|uniref:hypothetical protein n=1 Tax=Streptomyces sp. NPDC057486 TaxID=3346145 RepID=UPI0036B6DB35
MPEAEHVEGRETGELRNIVSGGRARGAQAPPFHSADGRTPSLLVNVGVATEIGFVSVYDVRESEPHMQNMAELIAPFSVQS